MPQPLDYSSPLTPRPPRPRWTGTISIAAFGSSTIALLIALRGSGGGYQTGERAEVKFLLAVSAVCATAAGFRLRAAVRTFGVGFTDIMNALGISNALLLIALSVYTVLTGHYR
jgi:hypothetical protein